MPQSAKEPKSIFEDGFTLPASEKGLKFSLHDKMLTNLKLSKMQSFVSNGSPEAYLSHISEPLH